MTMANGGLPSSELADRSRHLLRSLMFGLISGLLLLAFGMLAGEVLEGDTRTVDMYLLSQAESLRVSHAWVADIMRDLSGLGSTIVLTLFTAITVGYLMVICARATAVLVVLSASSGSVLVDVFKAWFGRVRPDPAYSEFVVSGLSFPSGHAAMSAAVFLTLGTLVATTRQAWTERIYILFSAITLTVLVGVSRVVLGVHWTTDVAAGWAFGSGWAIVWLLLAREVARRHKPS